MKPDEGLMEEGAMAARDIEEMLAMRRGVDVEVTIEGLQPQVTAGGKVLNRLLVTLCDFSKVEVPESFMESIIRPCLKKTPTLGTMKVYLDHQKG
jgi:hypothetical protein